MCQTCPPVAQEAEQLHQLRHGNIIALYGVCLAGPLGILLMARGCQGGGSGMLGPCPAAPVQPAVGSAAAHAGAAGPPPATALPCCPQEHAAGRDLHSALKVVKLGSSERLFGW